MKIYNVLEFLNELVVYNTNEKEKEEIKKGEKNKKTAQMESCVPKTHDICVMQRQYAKIKAYSIKIRRNLKYVGSIFFYPCVR